MRAQGGAYDNNGRYQIQDYSPMLIQAVIQPLEGRELQTVEEGFRTRATIKAYTRTKLNTLDVAAQTQPDHIIYNTRNYQVFRLEEWGLGGYYKCFLVETAPK
jgi:hypothetical protein